MIHTAGLAVHHALGPDDCAAKGLHDALVPEANTQDGHLSGQGLDQVHADARVVGCAGTGRDDQALRLQRDRLGDGNLVVAHHMHLGAQFPEGLHDVVRERVVVVDEQMHDYRPSSAMRTARVSARILSSDSWYSRAGSESATMPAPACTLIFLPRISRVLMVMHMSMSPSWPK